MKHTSDKIRHTYVKVTVTALMAFHNQIIVISLYVYYNLYTGKKNILLVHHQKLFYHWLSTTTRTVKIISDISQTIIPFTFQRQKDMPRNIPTRTR